MQEKNITYPTDSKLHRKIIKKYHSIAYKEGLQLRQSYSWTLNGWVLISASESIPETVRKPAVQTVKQKRLQKGWYGNLAGNLPRISKRVNWQLKHTLLRQAVLLIE